MTVTGEYKIGLALPVGEKSKVGSGEYRTGGVTHDNVKFSG